MKASHLQRVDLNLIKIFSAVYGERHVTRAGAILNMSQSAVSHGLRNLRDLFDDPLFVRTPDGMEPTAFAEQLAARIRGPLEEIQQALALTGDFDPAVAELDLTVGLTSGMHPRFIAGLCREVRLAAPNTCLLVRNLAPAEAAAALDSRAVQLVVSTPNLMLDSPRFGFLPLYEDEVVCVAARSNSEVGEVLDLDTYARLPHLVVASDRFSRTWVDDRLAEQGLRRRISTIVPTSVYIEQLVPDSPLLCTVMGSLVTPSPSLRIMTPPIAGPPHAFGLVWHARDQGHAPVTWLRDLTRRVWDACVAGEPPA